MAAAVICDVCKRTVMHSKATHIRMHRLENATTYYSTCNEHFDVCAECLAALKQYAKGLEVKKSAD